MKLARGGLCCQGEQSHALHSFAFLLGWDPGSDRLLVSWPSPSHHPHLAAEQSFGFVKVHSWFFPSGKEFIQTVMEGELPTVRNEIWWLIFKGALSQLSHKWAENSRPLLMPAHLAIPPDKTPAKLLAQIDTKSRKVLTARLTFKVTHASALKQTGTAIEMNSWTALQGEDKCRQQREDETWETWETGCSDYSDDGEDGGVIY